MPAPKTKEMTVHLLFHGEALCGQPGLPKDWPKDHYWARLEEKDIANCEKCLKTANTIGDDVTDWPAPPAAAVRFVHKKKPDPEPKTMDEVAAEAEAAASAADEEEPEDEGIKPDNDEHAGYIEWATRIAEMFQVKVYVVDVRAGRVIGEYEQSYALQFENDGYRSRIMVDPSGKVWECAVYT